MQTYLCDTSYKRHFINDIKVPAFKKKTGGFSSLKAYNNVTEANFILGDTKRKTTNDISYNKKLLPKGITSTKKFLPPFFITNGNKNTFFGSTKEGSSIRRRNR